MINKKYTVRYRRIRKQKTDYKTRLKLLLSNTPRLVIRCLTNSVNVQFIEYTKNGDRIITSSDSNELKKLGWKYSGNIPAAYLAGYIAGIKAKKAKVKMAIIDTGLSLVLKKTRIFAAVKGAIDAGIEIPCSKDALPSEERCFGIDIENYAKLLLKNKEQYQKKYSRYLTRNVKPEEIMNNVKKIKDNIK